MLGLRVRLQLSSVSVHSQSMGAPPPFSTAKYTFEMMFMTEMTVFWDTASINKLHIRDQRPREPIFTEFEPNRRRRHLQVAADDAEDGVPDDRIQLPKTPLKRTGMITLHFKFQTNRLRIEPCGLVDGQRKKVRRN